MSECWEWPGRLDRDGYGRWNKDLAHRLVWTGFRGVIPEGMTVDHICFNPACVRPDHLQLLTNEENARKQRSALATHCRRGHELTPDNLSENAGRRKCKKCDSLRHARNRASAPRGYVEHGHDGPQAVYHAETPDAYLEHGDR